MSDNHLIAELQLIDDIEAIEEEYESKYGCKPVSLSNWNPSSEVVGKRLLHSLPEISGDGIDYIFTYTLNDTSELRKSLNYLDNNWRHIITHSGSSAIVIVCNWLKASGFKNVLILGPRYFTVPYCLNALGINVEVQYCRRTESGYQVPHLTNWDNFDAIWLTNPVYGTGVQLDINEGTVRNFVYGRA